MSRAAMVSREQPGERAKRDAGRVSDGVALTREQPTPSVSVLGWVEREQRSHRFASSAHSDVELAWARSGALLYRVGSRELEVGPGAVVLLPAGREHETRITAGTVASSLHLSTELIAGVAEVLGPGFERRQLEAGLLPEPGRILRLAGLLLEESGEPGPGSALASEGLAEALAVQLVRGAPEPARGPRGHDPRILRALQLIEERAGLDLDVEQLARAAGMSRYHFSRRFREVMGRSPYQHLLEVRLSRAAELLRGGVVSVTEAALTAGFTDFGRFASFFRRRFGCPPSELSAARSTQRRARIA